MSKPDPKRPTVPRTEWGAPLSWIDTGGGKLHPKACPHGAPPGDRCRACIRDGLVRLDTYTILLAPSDCNDNPIPREYQATSPDDALNVWAQDEGHDSWAGWPNAPRGEVTIVAPNGSRTLR